MGKRGPKPLAGNNRDHKVTLRFNDQEQVELLKNKPSGISMAVWLREIIKATHESQNIPAKPILLSSSELIDLSRSLPDALNSIIEIIKRLESLTTFQFDKNEKNWSRIKEILQKHTNELKKLKSPASPDSET